MKRDARIGGFVLLLSLVLTTPCLAQTASRCTAGTIGGKCVNPGVANAAQQRSRLMVFQSSRTILPLSPGQDAAVLDPLLQSNKRQPQFGLDATGGGGLSGGGGVSAVYGRWN